MLDLLLICLTKQLFERRARWGIGHVSGVGRGLIPAKIATLLMLIITNFSFVFYTTR